ncbi:MAG: DUF2061 domain-containing protein [Rhodospirillales bacterium]
MSRKLIKTGTYSVMHLAVAVTVAYVLTRDCHIALGVGIIEPMVQTVAYSIHETLWGKVKDAPRDVTDPGGPAPAAA